jgi:hypothetical protein
MKIEITRRSKVGFGYTSAVENDEYGNLRVCAVTKPYHIGTILQVWNKIRSDRTLSSFRSGGTYYSTAWFVKRYGKWYKIVNDPFNNYELEVLSCKYENSFGKWVYGANVVTVETE